MLTIMLAALLAVPQVADDAASAAAAGEAPKRVRSVVLFGEDPCPKPSAPDEVVVCARSGDSPYRIPEKFREKPPETGPGVSWVRRVEDMNEANRSGLPGSCSTVGTGGQTGCTLDMLRAWTAEKKEKERAQGDLP